MSKAKQSWVWFALLMAGLLGLGIYVGQSRRSELGKSFEYSLDDFRQVDPNLIRYSEIDPIIPTISNVTALAIASDNTIYVAAENVIEILPSGKTISVDGTPSCLSVDESGMVYAGMQGHVAVFDKSWKQIDGIPPSEKTYLTSIDVDEWYIYAADAGNRRIWRFDKRKPGKPLEIGKKDWANGVRGFFVPSPFFDIAISRTDGSLWAVNPGHHALENYRPDGMPISSWESSSMTIEGFSGCCNPSHFALMSDGSFVTAEKGLPRVKIHNMDGSLRCVVATPDQFDDDVTGLDVAVDGNGLIYVLDPSRNQVRVFEKKR